MIVLGAAAPILSGLAQAPTPQVTFRAETALVRLDVTAVDGKGQVVADLRPDEFILEVNGVARPVVVAPWTEEGTIQAREGDSRLRPADADIRRSIAFFFANPVFDIQMVESDASASSTAANLVLARGAAAVVDQFLERDRRPSDLVAIIRREGPAGVLSRFTSDPETLLAAAKELREGWMDAGPPITLLRVPGAEPRFDLVADEGARILESAERVVGRMRALPGRRVLVFMSAFVRVDSGIRVSTSGVSSAARSLARAANRAGVTIIGVHPGRLGAARGPEESLLFLAGETGGDAIYNANDVADRVQDSLVRRRGHYLIGFEPSSGKGASGPDRPIKVSLKTRRQGVSIRTRREVFEDSGLYAGAPVLGKLSDHLDHPLRGSLDVRLTPHVDWKDGGKSRILAQIAIARPDTPEATPGRIDIETELRALDRRGRILLNETRTVRLRPKTRWIEFAREFEVADPDLVEVAIAARIAGTALVGSAASLAEVRRPKGLAFSTVAIRATPDGPPVMELENSGQVWMAVQVSGAARRNGRVDIELRTRLRRGQEIVLEDPPGGLSEALPEIFWVRATIETRSLGSGDYVCEVEALDRISNKRTTARREFRLLPPADVTRDR